MPTCFNKFVEQLGIYSTNTIEAALAYMHTIKRRIRGMEKYIIFHFFLLNNQLKIKQREVKKNKVSSKKISYFYYFSAAPQFLVFTADNLLLFLFSLLYYISVAAFFSFNRNEKHFKDNIFILLSFNIFFNFEIFLFIFFLSFLFFINFIRTFYFWCL